MQGGHPYAWKAWRDTIIAVVAVIAIASLASANPSLRAPRGSHESVVIVPTGATQASGPAGLSGPTGTTAPEIEPGKEGVPPSDGADFTPCEGLTGLEKAVCRLEALLVVHPDNQGLRHSLTHLQGIEAEHEAKAGANDSGHVPHEEDSTSSSNGHGDGQSHGNGDSHGNAGGSGMGVSGGNGDGH